MKAEWKLLSTDANLELMSEVLGVSEITAKVLANRGIRSKNSAISFLHPSEKKLHDIGIMSDTKKALKRIKDGIEDGKIIVYGDYDADGITSTVILCKVLRRLGANCEYYMPHRINDGYGLNPNAIEKINEMGAKLVIAVDNGISALEEVALANSFGIDVIVVDHHEPAFEVCEGRRTDILPPAFAILDPKQNTCGYPFKEICGAVLAYKLAEALCKYCGLDFVEKDELLVLAAIATLCDIVPLVDENRIIVKLGLRALNTNKLINPGLGSLIALRGYMDKPLDTFTVSYVLGPCLNATGRLESAAIAVDLLLSDQAQKSQKLAEELVRLNNERKNLTQECINRLMQEIPEKLPKVLVLTDLDAHESVAGIVAGRIREATGRPTILLTKGDGVLKGSGRSIEKYNFFEALLSNNHLFVRFGGHAMACGITMACENVDTLRNALNESCPLEEEDFRVEILLDGELSLGQINLKLSDELEYLAPYGKGNEEPLFASMRLYTESVKVLDEKRTLIFSFSKDGHRLKGIAFGKNELYDSITKEAGVNKSGGYFLDVVYTIETNEWNGVKSVQLRIRDFRVSS